MAFLLEVGSAGPLVLDRGVGVEPPLVRLIDGLGIEHDHQRRPVVKVGVEIPPLKGTPAPIGAQTVLPGGNPLRNAKPLVVVCGMGKTRGQLFHGVLPFARRQ